MPAMRILLCCGALVLVGCFGGGGEQTAPEGTGGSENQPTDGEGENGTGGATGGSTGSSTGGAGANDGTEDPYCAHAWNGFDALDGYIEVTNELSAQDATPAKFQENGPLAVEYAEAVGVHFGNARDFVVEDETRAAFDDMLLYQEKYLVPQSQIALGATDSEDYGLKSLEFILGDGVAEASAAGALASGTISAYTLQRCGSARWPE